ncbi:TonB family C-terminal domain-containing protein [Roseateles sp. YR242]|uniref:energy transducer TonB n=1 Tax=Roseateles sp. YR242 TaxID=1855305 RepID=UPI0008BF3951|nr:energy transducer TonB [Roseateles sp. YR242]SEL73664.1 TonB family C-terminal domain-containing protein [Roseateles sp. YR242]
MSNTLTTKTLTRGLLGLAAAMLLATAAHATPKIVKKVPPEFPAEAARQSISSGSVRAKMNIDPDGKVSGVEILEAEPRKVFDKAVTRALMDWRFEPSGEKQTHEVKLVFKNED